MNRVTVVVDSVPVVVSPDAPPSQAIWAVAMLRPVDEMTGGPPATPVRVAVEEAGVTARLGEDGRVGLVVQPSTRFPHRPMPLALHVWIRAERFLPRRVAVPIVRVLAAPANLGDTVLTLDDARGVAAGQGWWLGTGSAAELVRVTAPGPGPTHVTVAPITGTFVVTDPFAPDDITMVDLGDLPLHREPVTLAGRVLVFVPATQTWQPPTSGTLDITFIWRLVADSPTDSKKEALQLVAIAPGLYDDRRATADTLQPVTLTPVAADVKTLLVPVVPGTARIRVSNALGAAPGGLLRLDMDHPDVAETSLISAVTPDGVPAEPARIDVSPALTLDHRSGVTVQHVTAANTLTAKALAWDGLRGDPVIGLSDLAFGGTPSIARLAGSAPDEYQRVALFHATTDADGYFSFPPLTRVAKARVKVTVPAHPPQDVDVLPDYAYAQHRIDVRFA
jgi:hypothetical protein